MNNKQKQDLFLQITETGFFNQLIQRNLFLDFINSFKDLKSMKSTDGRPQFKNAEDDIRQHFIMNDDMELGDVFSSRVGLFSDDKLYDAFLLSVVASKYSEEPELSEKLVSIINPYLHQDNKE